GAATGLVTGRVGGAAREGAGAGRAGADAGAVGALAVAAAGAGAGAGAPGRAGAGRSAPPLSPAGTPAAVSKRATIVWIATVCPSCTRISASVPAAGDGISASTLSVEISKMGSSRLTASPT